MTRLEKLIQQFCPDGVAYKSIKQCTCKAESIKWGMDSKEYQYIDLSSVDRETKRITDTQTITANNAPSRAQQIIKADDILLGTTRPMLKRYCLVNKQYDGQICSTGFCVLRTNGIVLSGWLYHQIASNDFFNYVERNQKGASYPSISDASVKDYCIPVPPLEVQQEIVRILDQFTQLTAELTAELTARKQQYRYYRDQLLASKRDTPVCKMGDVLTFLNGRAYKQSELLRKGKYPVLRVGNFYTNDSWYYSDLELPEDKYCNKGDLLYSWAATLGPQIWDGGKCIFHYHIWKVLFDSDSIDREYLYYYLQYDLELISRSTTKSTMVHVSMESMKKRLIPLPPIQEQKRIASLIGKFDALCNDLTSGLPAEIGARQKQYEYYRDKLLTFKEKA